MQDMKIFAVGFEHSRWLSARVATLARNVANADTPGYKAQDVAPFRDVLASAQQAMPPTRAGHLPIEAEAARRFDLQPRATSTGKHSGNAVSLEAEMATLGDTRSRQSTVTGILGAFHRMLLSSARG